MMKLKTSSSVKQYSLVNHHTLVLQMSTMFRYLDRLTDLVSAISFSRPGQPLYRQNVFWHGWRRIRSTTISLPHRFYPRTSLSRCIFKQNYASLNERQSVKAFASNVASFAKRKSDEDLDDFVVPSFVPFIVFYAFHCFGVEDDFRARLRAGVWAILIEFLRLAHLRYSMHGLYVWEIKVTSSHIVN